MSKLLIYNKDIFLDYQKRTDVIASNAFILSNGDFILVDGYDARNATHLIERSSSEINKKLVKGLNIWDEYLKYLRTHEDAKKFYFLREILIHYYGLALFCDTDTLETTIKDDKRYSHFTIPAEKFFGKKCTEEQLETIKELIKLNCEDLTDFDENLTLKKTTL